MPAPFHTSRRVEFADTDMAGIVHFSNFFRFMESAEVDLLHTLGLSVRLEWDGQQLGFPRVAAACDYLRPVRFEDILEIAVVVDKIGRKSLTYAFEFTKDGEPIARGRITCVCCRIESDHRLESMEIPATLRARLEQSGHVREEPGAAL